MHVRDGGLTLNLYYLGPAELVTRALMLIAYRHGVRGLALSALAMSDLPGGMTLCP